MKKILHRGLVLFSLIFSGALLVSYSAAYINPGTIGFPAFFGLAYPYLLFANLLFVFYWMFRRKWTFLLPLIVILIGYSSIGDFFQLSGGDKKVAADLKPLNVLSYNVRSFDRYKWTKDPNTPNNIIKLINSQEPDVVCLQEYRSTINGFLSLKNLMKELGMRYVHYSNRKSGVAIFSKHKILKKASLSFGNEHLCKAIYADLQIKNKVLRVYNLHLESNRFVGKNYNFIKKEEYQGNEEDLDEIKDISLRLSHAFARRAEQALQIKEHVNQAPHETLICGDFNDTPNSYAYHQLSKGMKDAFVEQGKGISTTYSGDFPSFRIDYLLYSEAIDCIKYDRIRKRYSDHYPICGSFVFASK
ncbi:endonuclease/exonuclease/phosphatase family protein [Ancylomarina sp. DW003]|nr:endonuclease/exonuclease/phosphatase family protein [Ancylomarina sp. DW003]MDE5424344.1 endonuclease/exonuclease/phosphatase family protein [Ancylomarina sp. DW003]